MPLRLSLVRKSVLVSALSLAGGLGAALSPVTFALAEPPAAPAGGAGGAGGDAAQSKRPAEVILAEFDGLELPEVRPGPADGQRDAAEKRKQGVEKLNELAMEFYRSYPEHERAAPLLYTRWNNMFPVEGGPRRVHDEAAAVIKENKTAACVTEALFWNAIASGPLNEMDIDKIMPEIERFVAHAPKDERGALMMMSLANRLSRDDTDRSARLMRRVVELYPESDRAKIARARLRIIDGLNKPFELAFTDAITGEKVDVQKMKGKVVIIDFWATWCGPCVREMPKLKALYEEFPNELEIVGVSLDKPESEGGLSKLKDFVAKNQYNWKHYYQGNGWESEFSMSWDVTSIPRVFIVDQNGLLVEPNARPVLEETVRKLIEQHRKKSS